MPIELSFIENNGILFKGTGVLTGKDISTANEFIYESPGKIREIAYQLCDYTEIEKIDMSSDEIRILASQDEKAAKINPQMIIAVVGKEDIVFGLSRMWQAYADETAFETCVFRNIEDAKIWIFPISVLLYS